MLKARPPTGAMTANWQQRRLRYVFFEQLFDKPSAADIDGYIDIGRFVKACIASLRVLTQQ
jgi:hypothetical protein